MLRRHEYVQACDGYFTRLTSHPHFAQLPENGYQCRSLRLLRRLPALRAACFSDIGLRVTRVSATFGLKRASSASSLK
jgi:hypothetical protein